MDGLAGYGEIMVIGTLGALTIVGAAEAGGETVGLGEMERVEEDDDRDGEG